MPRKKPDLSAKWNKREQDIMFHYEYTKSDGHWLHGWLSTARWPSTMLTPQSEKSFLNELEERGFDITTLKISVCYDSNFIAARNKLYNHINNCKNCSLECNERKNLLEELDKSRPHKLRR